MTDDHCDGKEDYFIISGHHHLFHDDYDDNDDFQPCSLFSWSAPWQSQAKAPQPRSSEVGIVSLHIYPGNCTFSSPDTFWHSCGIFSLHWSFLFSLPNTASRALQWHQDTQLKALFHQELSIDWNSLQYMFLLSIASLSSLGVSRRRFFRTPWYQELVCALVEGFYFVCPKKSFKKASRRQSFSSSHFQEKNLACDFCLFYCSYVC